MADRILARPLADLRGQYPIVTLTGPRQSGKTTLCRQTCGDLPYVNLEAPDVRAFAETDPRGFLSRYRDGAVFEEVQRAPDLLSYLQVLVDERAQPGRFVLTGSHQLLLDAKVSQSLAGRTGLLTLLPLSIAEVATFGRSLTTDEYLLRGFYPRIHDQGLDPGQALGDYFATYVERDVRQLSQIRDLSQFRRFVTMCAGRIGQLLNYQSLGSDVGVTHSTARQWISVLEASYIVFLVPPYLANIGKRLVKAHKLYFHDVGLASYLLGIEHARQIATHPLRGALFENLVMSEAQKHRTHHGRRSKLHFYRDSSGLECDGIEPTGDGTLAFEVKAAATLHDRQFETLAKVVKLLPGRSRGRVLVYDGDEEVVRSGVQVTHSRGFAGVLDRLDAAD